MLNLTHTDPDQDKERTEDGCGKNFIWCLTSIQHIPVLMNMNNSLYLFSKLHI